MAAAGPPGHPPKLMNAWKSKWTGPSAPTWSVSRDQQLQKCERRYYFQYLAGGRINSPDPRQRRIGMLKKLKTARMWQGDCLHWAIARYLSAARDGGGAPPNGVISGLKGKMEREWQFSNQKRFRDQPALIDKGGLALLEHEYDESETEVAAAALFEEVKAGFERFLNWAAGAARLVEKVKTADNVWIEPPVFGEDAPSFMADGVQVLAKVDLAIEKTRSYFEIYDWKTGGPVEAPGTTISQNELQVSVYQLWPHLSMKLPLTLISSHLLYLGNSSPEIRSYTLDEQKVPLILLMVRNSISQARRWEQNISSGQMSPEELDFAASAVFCRDCPFKGLCRETLQNEKAV